MATPIIGSRIRPLRSPPARTVVSGAPAPGFGAGLYSEVGFPPRREPASAIVPPFDDEQPHPSS